MDLEPTRNKDYYSMLGLTPRATQDEIRRAYCRMVKECHPDLNPSSTDCAERLKLLREAYKTLSDSKKREDYDRSCRLFGFKGGTARFEGPHRVHYPSPRNNKVRVASIEQRKREAIKPLVVWLYVVLAIAAAIIVYHIYSIADAKQHKPKYLDSISMDTNSCENYEISFTHLETGDTMKI
jgi:curved DNA-binding protein CbpA